jgi:Ca2+-binding RTX toxin-like protein
MPQREVAMPLISAGYYDVTGDDVVTQLDADAIDNFHSGLSGGWQNSTDRFDVNRDGVESPVDALAVINDLNASGPHLLTGHPQSGDLLVDITGDIVVSSLDAAQILDKLNGGSGDINPPGRNPLNPFEVDGFNNGSDAGLILNFLSFGYIGLPGPLTINEVHIRSHGGADVVNVSDAVAWIFGGAGNDFLSAANFNDFLDGGDGNDSLIGNNGNNTITGGSGDDYVLAGNGADTVDGGNGADLLYGGAGDDILIGGNGNDTISGGDGVDTLSGDAGDDAISGGANGDYVDGGAGNDSVAGDAGDDEVNGGDGDDVISGGDGNDTLYGGAGSDTMDGGSGTNTIDTNGVWLPALVGYTPYEPHTFEGQTAQFTFFHVAGSGKQAVVLTIAIEDGEAHEIPGPWAHHGSDFGGPATFTVIIPAGLDSVSDPINVPLLHDDQIETQEFYWIEIISVSGGGIAPAPYDKGDYFIDDASVEAKDDEVEAGSDAPIVIGVLANDYAGASQDLHVASFTLPAHGTVDPILDGLDRIIALQYTRDSGYVGPDTFTYTAADDDGQMSTASVVIGGLIDLDDDANEDGQITNADDPIEADPPGAFVQVNLDDDNNNGIADWDEPGPVSGENDLQPFLVNWGGNAANHSGWHVTLTMDPAPDIEFDAVVARIFTSADKSGRLMFVDTPIGPAIDWVIGSGAIPSTLYLEAGVAGLITLQLHLFDPSWILQGPIDTVLFLASDTRVGMRIGNGISHDFDGSGKRAFTVANLNDSDGDGEPDVTDNSVKNTIKGVEYKELDLMPLKIAKPIPYNPAKRLTFSVLSGDVKFWREETKEAAVDMDSLINTWAADETEKTVWVEATKPSTEIGKIHLQLKYDGVTSEVFATAIWAKVTVVKDDALDANGVFNAFPNIRTDPYHRRIKELIEEMHGTGLIPPFYFPMFTYRVQNGIVIQFTVTPPGLADYRRFVKFDITRRLDVDAAVLDPNNVRQPGSDRTTFPDIHPDAANDEIPGDRDEDNSAAPDNTSQMYSYDAPGLTFGPIPEVPNGWRGTYVGNFEEFMRVNIGVPPDPSDPTQQIDRPDGGTKMDPKVSGSRVSPKYAWSARHTMAPDRNGLMQRTTGDKNETESNNIKGSALGNDP